MTLFTTALATLAVTMRQAPCDDKGHGTHTIGTAIGDDGMGNQIGMAPGAKWIGCRNMDQGNGTPARYIECMEFFLAPYPVGGTPAQGDPTLGARYYDQLLDLSAFGRLFG